MEFRFSARAIKNICQFIRVKCKVCRKEMLHWKRPPEYEEAFPFPHAYLCDSCTKDKLRSELNSKNLKGDYHIQFSCLKKGGKV